MNYYEIFYWITVADSAKRFFDAMSDIFTFLAIVSFIAFLYVKGVQFFDPQKDHVLDEKGNWLKDQNDSWVYEESKGFVAIRKTIALFFYFTTFFCIIFWAGYVFTPTKKDGLLIVAAGGTLNYLSTDSAAKQLPHDMINFVSTELKSLAKEAEVEIKGLNDKQSLKDELLQLPKEQLIERMKTDSIARKLFLE